MSRRIAAALAALHGFAGVAVSAIGAHAVSAADYRPVMTGAAIQIAHALAALVALSMLRGSAIAWAFIIGAALFAGAIDLRVFAGLQPGPVAPIGGTVLMLTWLAFAALLLKNTK
jgi:uncharacterized membrane protein YgdD (TMEM256/DUF423 family)